MAKKSRAGQRVKGGRKRIYRSDKDYRAHLRDSTKAGLWWGANGDPQSKGSPISDSSQRHMIAGYNFGGNNRRKHRAE